jgi:hypothetical protein
MKYVLLSFCLFVTACAAPSINTGQDIEVALLGTDAAYCRLSTDTNRYALDAPGTAFIERDPADLKIDCDDNFTDRRRTVVIEPSFGFGYWNYPDKVVIDFTNLENGNRFNGFRAESQPIALIANDANNVPAVISEILTEESYSAPVPTTQNYPVKKDYVIGRRSYPVMQ